ncbi:unnamed protein product [Callosobruchus maculatus]|uniref:Uncharacterized protein n=1 Tax=Callosobruchus maculatus TaxID=64391 RepID=A0A653D1G0_CALMS|nr:unnamed protein product [Callosobruchus maculatus]
MTFTVTKITIMIISRSRRQLEEGAGNHHRILQIQYTKNTPENIPRIYNKSKFNMLAVGVGWWRVAGPVAPQPVGRRRGRATERQRAGPEPQGRVGRSARPLVEWAAPREVYQFCWQLLNIIQKFP